MKHTGKTYAVQVVSFLLITFVSLCPLLFAQTEMGNQENTPDPWFFAPSKKGEKWNELKPQRSYRVKPAFISRYTENLKSVKFKKIGWPEAQLIVGNSMDETEGYEPYLVRGLMINDGTGGFEILQNRDEILVSHFGLGEFTSWKKQPLVVILQHPPEEVYTVAQTAL